MRTRRLGYPAFTTADVFLLRHLFKVRGIYATSCATQMIKREPLGEGSKGREKRHAMSNADKLIAPDIAVPILPNGS